MEALCKDLFRRCQLRICFKFSVLVAILFSSRANGLSNFNRLEGIVEDTFVK